MPFGASLVVSGPALRGERLRIVDCDYDKDNHKEYGNDYDSDYDNDNEWDSDFDPDFDYDNEFQSGNRMNDATEFHPSCSSW